MSGNAEKNKAHYTPKIHLKTTGQTDSLVGEIF